MRTSKTRIRLSSVIIYILLILLVFICIVPFYVMVINSTHTTNELYTGVSLIPGTALASNLKNLFSKVDMLRGFENSALISVTSTFLSVYFGAMTAFGLYEYQFKLRKAIYVILMCSLMIPGQLTIVGLFRLCNILGMVNTYWPLILPSVANATTIFFLMQYMKTAFDKELFDAARIDGASELKIFHQMILPLAVPALATQAIFNFVGYWNNFFTPMILIFDDRKYTVPLLINNLNNGLIQDLGTKYAGIMLSIIPIIIVYLFFSRYITEGVMAGSMKG